MYSTTLSLTSELDEGGWSTPGQGRFTPGKETRYPLYRRLGWLQGRSGRVRKTSLPPGFNPRTVQAVGSRYTDCAIRANTTGTRQSMPIPRLWLAYMTFAPTRLISTCLPANKHVHAKQIWSSSHFCRPTQAHASKRAIHALLQIRKTNRCLCLT